ncbi:unnamed protein product [Lactuca virosa]|uniref:L-ascorbate oxidase n=1 Tax=Lactuca virosa TaxID=75947 RepID=A0AAU9NIA4_9ASTR|nr:unnamed protein product [Lactuca virosa]
MDLSLIIKLSSPRFCSFPFNSYPGGSSCSASSNTILDSWKDILRQHAEDPYRFFTFEVTYGQISPLGVSQRGILINGKFPGPTIDCITNDNVIVNVINKLDEPFLITWNGIKQRKTSWQDGMHRAVGGFGAINVRARAVIFVPYLKPVEEFTLLISDWWKSDHKTLQQTLDSGNTLPMADALLINGHVQSTSFTTQKGQRYMFRVSNVALTTSINFRIQNHTLTLVETEGSHTLQESYESLDIHVGQSASFLVNLNAPLKDYFIVASTRFTKPVLTATATLHYDGSTTKASLLLPWGPTYEIHWSMKQARTIRWNLTANAARPNPQGSYHYGTIPVTRTVVLANSAANINGKLRYAVNQVSYANPETPLKIADFYNIPGVFHLSSIKDSPPSTPPVIGASVMGFTLHDFVEIVFQNNEGTIQSWHLDGSDFWAVGFGSGQWNATLRKRFYNLNDATTRHTMQVYPNSWSAILVSMDNKGMWNLRSAIWPRRYLGQELYTRVWNDEKSSHTEYDIPLNALRCGKAPLN